MLAASLVDHSPGGRCSLKRNFSLFVKDPLCKVSAGEAVWSYSGGAAEADGCVSGAVQRTSELTEGAAELFKVDEAILVLVYQAKDPEGEGALGGAESPGLQQGEEHTKLLETQLVLLQIGQAGVMMEQSRALHCPVATAEMLPLKIENKGQNMTLLFFIFVILLHLIIFMSATHFEQVVKLIKLGGSESDFLGHHPDLKIGLRFTLNTTETMQWH